MLNAAKAEALRLTHDEFRADDLAALVIKRLYSRDEAISLEGRVAYVKACVRNAYFDELRHNRAAMRGGGDIQELPDDDLMTELHSLGGTPLVARSPSQKVIGRERKRAMHELVQRILDELTDRQREMLMLAATEMSNDEIAIMMGYANSDVVKATISRLRKRIREVHGLDIERVFREW